MGNGACHSLQGEEFPTQILVWSRMRRFARDREWELKNVVWSPNVRLISATFDSEEEADKAKAWVDSQTELFHVRKARTR
jgi:hypothetical protein